MLKQASMMFSGCYNQHLQPSLLWRLSQSVLIILSKQHTWSIHVHPAQDEMLEMRLGLFK
jgi:hypothetical protein